MKAPTIRFFLSSDNSQQHKEKKVAKPPKVVILTGYISPSGKLVFPAKTVSELGVDLANTAFKVGMQAGKRKAKSLYLIPASADQPDTFQLQEAAKNYTLSLPIILKKSGVDFVKARYNFLINLFDYEGVTSFELALSQQDAAAKVPYTGKPRGRKPKGSVVVE